MEAENGTARSPGDTAGLGRVAIRLARIAERVLARNTAVTPTRGIGDRITIDGPDAIVGVVAAESSDGSVDLDLHVRTLWPPTPTDALARLLTGDLRRQARREGLGERLRDVRVHDDRLERALDRGWR
ncbi:MAG TPA: hypothetical protein VGC32_03320 [Solirubrobacterales bacterium]